MSDIVNHISKRLNIENQSLLDFVLLFSRFEYSLKKADYFGERGNSVYADWDRYARSELIVDIFDGLLSDEVKAATEYLLENYPKKQTVEDATVKWKDSPPDANLSVSEQVILMVRRIRNNLLHGGKFNGTHSSEVARNKDLIHCSIVILEYCIKNDEQIESYILD